LPVRRGLGHARPDALVAGLAGAGGAHGAQQLPAAVAGLQPVLPWLRAGAMGTGAARLAIGPGAGLLPAAGPGQPLVDATVPPWAGGVAVAQPDLPARAAAARLRTPA